MRKRLEGKEIEEVEEVKGIGLRRLLGRGAGETMVCRVFTSYDRTDYLNCQCIKWVLVFRDWAQDALWIRRRKAHAKGEQTLPFVTQATPSLPRNSEYGNGLFSGARNGGCETGASPLSTLFAREVF